MTVIWLFYMALKPNVSMSKSAVTLSDFLNVSALHLCEISRQLSLSKESKTEMVSVSFASFPRQVDISSGHPALAVGLEDEREQGQVECILQLFCQ